MFAFKSVKPIDDLFSQVEKLYYASFPLCERRDTQDWKKIMINKNIPFSLIAIVDNTSTFCGFISYWTFSDFFYIEHFAIQPNLRSLGIGKSSLNEFCANHKNVVLEIEPPLTVMAERRLKFYENNGFKVLSTTYIQPPYRVGESCLNLYLMGFGMIDKAKVIRTIYKNVYYKSFED